MDKVLTRNNKHIAKEISKLNVQVHFNIFDKDKKNTWGFLNLLASAEIKMAYAVTTRFNFV